MHIQTSCFSLAAITIPNIGICIPISTSYFNLAATTTHTVSIPISILRLLCTTLIISR